jgi:hypothetical protein
MTSYTDRYGRWHDRPTDGINYSSNNGWYYTAVAHKLGLLTTTPELLTALHWCRSNIQRHPYINTTPYWSRDEELGAHYLISKIGCNTIINRTTFWPIAVPKPEFNLFKFIHQAIDCIDWKLRKPKHRNHWHVNELWQIGYTAFIIPLSDRWYHLRLSGKNSLWWYILHITLHLKQPTDRSARLLRWFKTGKDIGAVINYFGADHPFSKHVMGRR